MASEGRAKKPKATRPVEPRVNPARPGAAPVGAVVGGAIGATSGAAVGVGVEAVDEKSKQYMVVAEHEARRP
jgi:hypothetical protein